MATIVPAASWHSETRASYLFTAQVQPFKGTSWYNFRFYPLAHFMNSPTPEQALLAAQLLGVTEAAEMNKGVLPWCK